MPLISLFTLFIWPVFLYWSKPMQRDWLYKRATDIRTATHIYIRGRDENQEIVNILDYRERSNELIKEAQHADPGV